MTRALLVAMLLVPAVPVAVAQPSAAPVDAPSEKSDEPEDKPIKPDPRAVAEAREANLEPESQRSGLAVGFAFGPNVQISSGLRDASGTGGGLAIRFGTVASPRWVWLAELASTGYVQKEATGNKVNSSTLFTLGGQLYAKEAFWFRGGAGPANFTRRSERGGDPSASFWGFGVIGAGGLDIVRRHSLAISLEVLTTLARYRDGFVGAGSMQLGFSWY
jgi:hypothetical protein